MQFFKRDINKQNRNGEVSFYNVGDTSSQSSSGGVTLDQVRRNFVSIEFFKKLFQAHDSTDSDNILNIDPNDTDSTITDLEFKFGSWSSYFISALGRNSSGGGGGGSVGVLNDLDDVDTTGAANGKVLTYQNGMWVPGTGGGSGSVSWADITDKPTTLSGYGITDAIPLTGSDRITGKLEPNTNNSIDLGSSSYRWRYVYGVNGSFSSSLTVGGTDVSLDGHTHSASDITSGTFAVSRIPTNISITGNAATATTASKLGSSTVGGGKNPIYLSSGTPTASSSTEGSSTRPVYLNGGTITQCGTSLAVDVTGNAASATKLATARTLWGQSFNGTANVKGTITSDYFKLNDNTSNPYLQLSHTYNSTDYTYYVQAYQGLLQLGPSAAKSIKITSNGELFTKQNVILNGADASSSTGNTSQILFMAGTTAQVAISSNTNALIINPTLSTTTGQWVIGVNGHDTYTTGSGNFGIGMNNPSQKLHVSGNILATGAVTALSDMRRKSPVSEVNTRIEDMAKLPIFYYKWKMGYDDDMHIGTSAQEVQKLFPELVIGKEDLSVNYPVLGTTLGILNSRKLTSHEKEIKALKKENKALKERIKALEDRV